MHSGGEAPTVWAIVEFDRERHRVSYLRVAPDSHVARIDVECAEAGPEATRVEVRYTFTGLGEPGNAYVATFTAEHFRAWNGEWEAALEHHLRHGTRLRHQAEDDATELVPDRRN